MSIVLCNNFVRMRSIVTPLTLLRSEVRNETSPSPIIRQENSAQTDQSSQENRSFSSGERNHLAEDNNETALQQQPIISKFSSFFKRGWSIIFISALTIMNAAVTIFSVGVGVGMILGDSFRPASSHSQPSSSNSCSASNPNSEIQQNEGTQAAQPAVEAPLLPAQ